ISVTAMPGPELRLQIAYDGHRVGAAGGSRTAGHLRIVVQGIAAEPGVRLADLPSLTAGERQQLLGEWSAGTAREAPVLPVHRLIERVATSRPEAPAVIFEGGALTHGELHLQADRLARRLRELGVGPEILVGICLEHAAELAVALLAVLRSGGAYL